MIIRRTRRGEATQRLGSLWGGWKVDLPGEGALVAEKILLKQRRNERKQYHSSLPLVLPVVWMPLEAS